MPVIVCRRCGKRNFVAGIYLIRAMDCPRCGAPLPAPDTDVVALQEEEEEEE